jgi:hypothetical protein
VISSVILFAESWLYECVDYEHENNRNRKKISSELSRELCEAPVRAIAAMDRILSLPLLVTPREVMERVKKRDIVGERRTLQIPARV